MQLGMIGAGRMGSNMARRLRAAGHEVVFHDVDDGSLKLMEDEGFETTRTLADLVASLNAPRNIWIMIPAARVGSTIAQLGPILSSDDTIVDGGNSWYRDDVGRAATLGALDVNFVDCGTSGGVYGLERGYCLMIGGDAAPVERLRPIFEALAPGVGTEARTEGRSGETSSVERGYMHCGPAGAGHFVKMVHNGIEYGIMAAYAEGLNLMRHVGVEQFDSPKNDGAELVHDSTTFDYDIDVAEVTELWRRGSVVGSWLLDLTARAMYRDPLLDAYTGRVSDSGEGRWTMQAAIDLAVPVPVLSAALFSRFESRGKAEFAGQVLSAMRESFGGHQEVL